MGMVVNIGLYAHLNHLYLEGAYHVILFLNSSKQSHNYFLWHFYGAVYVIFFVNIFI